MNARHVQRYAAFVLLTCSISTSAVAQEMVISTYSGPLFGGPGPLVVIRDLAHDLPAPIPFYVAPVGPIGYPSGQAINPHGLALLSRDKAVGTHGRFDGPTNFVDIIDLPTASLDGWFFPGGANDFTYYGYGSAALAPDGAYLLLASGSDVAANRTKLFVVPTPISSTSVASDIIALPGDFGTAQTHGIVFDPMTRRAYVGHSNGITAIDPPYASANVAFTIPLPPIVDSHHVSSYAVELSPDSSTLLAADQSDSTLRILHAPFSAASNIQTLTIAGGHGLDGIAITPDGGQALVVDSLTPQVFAVEAPFSASSAVEMISLASFSLNGFEDLAISPDGHYAAITGNGGGPFDPLIILRAPFTAAGVTAYALPFVDVGPPYGPAGRGAGTVRFWSEPGALPPQVRINRISVTEGDSGTSPATYTVTLSRPSTQPASVDYATTDGTAHAGIHYQATSGTLDFPPGAVQRTISVPIIGNTLAEGTRSFRINLSNGANAVVLQEPGSGAQVDGLCSIVDDDSGYIASEPPLPDATVGEPYAFQFAAEHFTSALTWSVDMSRDGPPPAGLSLNSTTGVLSGVPTMPTIAGDFGSGYFVVHVAGPPLQASREYYLTVRSDRIFADGFEPAGAARPPLQSLPRHQRSRQHDAASFDPAIATRAVATYP